MEKWFNLMVDVINSQIGHFSVHHDTKSKSQKAMRFETTNCNNVALCLRLSWVYGYVTMPGI